MCSCKASLKNIIKFLVLTFVYEILIERLKILFWKLWQELSYEVQNNTDVGETHMYL